MSVTQSNNKADRDIVGGNKFEGGSFNFIQPTSLSRLYQILRDAEKAAPYTAQIAETLQHYCASTTTADVRGLDDKLSSSGRADLLQEASAWKERASKLIMRWQTSPVTQDIITHILAKIHTEFMLSVRPAIQAGKSREEVDELISSKVIGPTNEMLGDNDLGLTYIDLVGLLFFLGGNCHVRWDKC
jgi:hypothetical protein